MRNDYINYFNEKISYDLILKFLIDEKKNKNGKLLNYPNNLSDTYMNNDKEIIKKYSNTNNEQLKIIINNLKYYYKYKIYLYDLILAYHNNIIDFEYYNNNIFKPSLEKNIKQREKDFMNYLKDVIKYLELSLKLKITVPYIICKKFMNDIKPYKKYKFLYSYLKKNYLKECRKTIGLYDLPNGKNIYKYAINNETGGIKLSPQKIHRYGLKILPKKVEKVDKKDFYNSKEVFFNDCIKISLYIYNNIIDKYFHYKPEKPFDIRKVPKKLEKTTSLAYYDELTDAVYINMKYYKECNRKSIYSLLMHECFHQYHFNFLKHYNVDYYKIYGFYNNAFIEGFAHYMEIYCEDYNDNNEYSLLRKARLVVDTGIHYYGWTYKKAYNFMLKYMPKRKKDIQNEILRYICIPAQSLGYNLGKREIIKLRNKYLKKNKGTIKDFHHNLLINGTISFTYLKKILDL